MRSIRQLTVLILIFSFTYTNLSQAAHAALISTEQLAQAQSDTNGKQKLDAILARPELIIQMQKMGISHDQALVRVAALSDEEASIMANKIDSMPAGGDVVGVLFTIFIILLITDILGLTKIFPFTRSVR